MTSPDSEIRKYLQGLVITESGVGTSVVPIYDRVPEALAYPFIHISDINNADMSTKSQTIWDVDLLLDVVTGYDSKGGGRKSADAIGNSLLTAILDSPYIDLGGYYTAMATLVNSNYLDEDAGDNYIVRKLLRINLQIELQP